MIGILRLFHTEHKMKKKQPTDEWSIHGKLESISVGLN